ncbi:taste receptor, type 2, member 201, tandem duplicate 1, partial [Silurus meridionalis]
MEFVVCVAVNIPCAALGLVINLFYIFCLIFPLGQTINIKQPLSTLLVLMIFCTSLFQVSLILHLSLGISVASWNFKHAAQVFMFYAVRVSIPTTLWLNICYCIQIVPSRMTFFTWLKRNIRIVVYLFVIFTKIYFLVYFILEYISVYGLTLDTFGVNSTAEYSEGIDGASRIQLNQFLDVLDAVTMALVFMALTAMLGVTSTTVCYLYQHIKKMTASGTSIHSQVLRNQVRVTITGVVQGLLYLLCSMGMFLDLYCTYHKYKCDWNVLWTIFCVYSLAATLNLGVGQSQFRQRIAQLWRK